MPKAAGLTNQIRELAKGLRKMELKKGIHFIYVAAKCDDLDPEQRKRNIEYATQMGLKLIEKGYVPFIAHIAIAGLNLPRHKALLLDLLWLMRCDALLYANSSSGADREYNVAKALDIPVFYDIDEVPVSLDLNTLREFIIE